MKLVNMLDLGSSAARLMGSSPITRTSSEIPTTVPFPASPKTALWWEFLRFPPRLASLDSRRKGNGETRGGRKIDFKTALIKEALIKSTCADLRQKFLLTRKKIAGILTDFKIF